MTFDVNNTGIQRVANLITISWGSGNTQTINFSLNLGSLYMETGKLTGNDEYPAGTPDGKIQAGETINHDTSFIPIFDIPDLNNASVLAVGQMSALVTGIFYDYPVILVQQGSAQYLIYPEGKPNLFDNILGTLNTRITFYKNGSWGPGGFDPGEPPCFARGTMIETDKGKVAVEDLRAGDLVRTMDNGFQPIVWIRGRILSTQMLAENENLRPIRIKAGALNGTEPLRDLVVSPQHRILVRSRIAQRMFGAPEVLVAAKQLCAIDGIEVAHDLAEVEYFHFLFERHEIVYSEGAATESLYTGPQALASVGTAARDEIFALFPELRDVDYAAPSARPLVPGRGARKLAMRHARNSLSLCEA